MYGCIVNPEDYLVRRDKNMFDRKSYFENPDEYRSIFHEKIAPYASFIINGIFWNEKYPRLLTCDQVEEMSANDKLRLITVADVSCDVNVCYSFPIKLSSFSSRWLRR